MNSDANAMSAGLVSGYLHFSYLESLMEFGTPLFLPRSRSWILKRYIPGSSYCDAMGPYPILVCEDWSQLQQDLEDLADDLVAVSAVTDPFGNFEVACLRSCFPNVMKAFKQHFVTDLKQVPESFVHPHHLRKARKALQEVEVECSLEPSVFLEDWLNLYQALINRHRITGIAAFSRSSFASQLSVPGIMAFRAVENGETVSMLLWYEHADRAYYHLGASSQRGYALSASFALFDYSLRYFSSRRLKWLDLGAGSGASHQESGLTRFKRGWCNGVRTAYFCGRVFSHDKYKQLVSQSRLHSPDYFPVYRAGEFK